MTIFPCKWRGNEQQGKGWAPTIFCLNRRLRQTAGRFAHGFHTELTERRRDSSARRLFPFVFSPGKATQVFAKPTIASCWIGFRHSRYSDCCVHRATLMMCTDFKLSWIGWWLIPSYNNLARVRQRFRVLFFPVGSVPHGGQPESCKPMPLWLWLYLSINPSI